MDEDIYKVIELAGSSKTGIEDAVQHAISRASNSIRKIRWFEVSEIRGQIDNGRVAYWQVVMKIGFNVETEQGIAEKPQEKDITKEATKEKPSAKYQCSVCGYIYDPKSGDPDNGIMPGTAFEALPDDWVCPECGVGKDRFEKMG